MAELLPNWLQENCYPAQYDRLLIGNLIRLEGVADYHGGDLLVTTGGAALNLSVAQGGAFIEGDDDDRGVYSVYNDAAVTLTATAANPTNPRIDQVIARVYDSTYGEGADEWVLEMLDGTATGGATLTNLAGATALPDNSIRLAYVLVPATFAGPFVNATHIRDVRTGYIPASTAATGTLVRVYRTAAATIAAAGSDLVYDTVSFGNALLFNTTTGVYTAPVTGYYRVGGQLVVTNNAAETLIICSVFVNGVSQWGWADRATTTLVTNNVSGSVVVYALAGQGIKVQGAHNGAGSLTVSVGPSNTTYASFELIG